MLKQVHLINPMGNASGGSEWRTLRLCKELSKYCDVHLWSSSKPNPRFSGYPMRRLSLSRLSFPMTGTFIIVGVYHELGSWIHLARPTRTILIYNTSRPDLLRARLQTLQRFGKPKAEIVFAARWLMNACSLSGPVEMSPLDLQQFAPDEYERDDRPNGRFTIGRLSRDHSKKHHPNDAGIYRRLVSEGGTVKIMGGRCLAGELDDVPEITLLPSGAQEPDVFLKNLDCFFYRTSDKYFEPSGRVVSEAMACGLPVVCHRRGGYSEYIEDRVDGFLFDSDAEAVEILLTLKADPALRKRVGQAARKKLEASLAPTVRDEFLRFYTR
ncbi:MAG TPA: glycosyltransferase family 4 protein [Nitrospira sp.]|nr:glycosyltransferase family 4 protein [Nitrospira sp.]